MSKRTRLFSLLLAIPLFAAPAVAVPPVNLGDAKWIWPAPNATGTFYFRKSFAVPDGVKSARVMVCCDNSATVYINGKDLGKAEPRLTLYPFDLTPYLRPGKNTLALACTNPKGPGAVIAKIFLDSSSPQSFPTDHAWKLASAKPVGDWTSPDFDDASWSSSPELGPDGTPPWPYLGYPLTLPPTFPTFQVPGHEAEMESLRYLYYLHYAPAQPLIPLWDEWMPNATLWPAQSDDRLRHQWTAAFASRPMGPDGYIFTLQHDGTGHAQGWPFPLWQQGGGIGWHFVGTGVPGYEPPLAKGDVFTLTNGSGGAVTNKGLPLTLTQPHATATTPAFKVPAKLAPWLRLNWWAAGLDGANPYVEWTTTDHPDFSPDRRIYFSPPSDEAQRATGPETRTMIPAYKHPAWKGTVTQLRLNFDNPSAAQLVIKSFHTAFDTRQTVNNFNFIRGCADTFDWTGDYAFLRSQMPRIRTAMRFIMNEFQTRQHKCVYTTWPGHEGRSGVQYVNGQKRVIPGNGIGSNYWDILPWGGEDALATVYYYDTLLKLADLEEQITRHPEWNVPAGADAYDPADLRAHAQEVKDYGTRRFWNPATQRFGTVDLDGQMHDYGFTFLNNEAVYYHFATPDQAKAIRSWLDGARTVKDDTSTGDDIYHWRFGPRSTTKRNLDYYFWGWSDPGSIPFGAQVQDGGAVLGWSYHDLMAILATDGPDAAAKRLSQILSWFDDTQAAGGYRAYYSDPSRGTMQGANVAGGLGLDKEFFESVLPPNVMLYGFLGLHPTPTGLSIHPNLPKDWPSLTINNIRLHEHTLTVTATHDGVTIESDRPTASLDVVPPDPTWTVVRDDRTVRLTKR